MSAITIDKQSALVLIDPQQGILAPPALLDPDDIKTRDQRLAAASRASTLPVAQVKLAFSADGGRSSARPRPHARPGIRPAGGVFRIPRGLPLSPRRHHPGQAALGGVHRNGAGPPAPPPRRDPDRAGRHLHQHRRGIHSAERLGKQLPPDLRRRRHHRGRRCLPHAHLHQDLSHLGEIATTEQIIDTLKGRSVGLGVEGSITRASRRSENAGM